jgi:hypothetical protein
MHLSVPSYPDNAYASLAPGFLDFQEDMVSKKCILFTTEKM